MRDNKKTQNCIFHLVAGRNWFKINPV